MKRRYNLYFGHVEMSVNKARCQYGDALPEGLFEQDQEPELIASFETEQEAREALKKYCSEVKRFNDHGVWHIAIEGYYVDEEELADGDWQPVATIDWTKMPESEEE